MGYEVDLGGYVETTSSLTNLTFADNNAGSAGGAIYSGEGHLKVINSTFINNGSTTFYGPVEFHNSLFVKAATGSNCPLDGTSGWSSSNSLADDASCGPGFTPVYTGYLRLRTLGDYGGGTQTVPLLEGSVALDAGGNLNCPHTDQRGVARPLDGNGDGIAVCDVGAVEMDAGSQPGPTYTANVADWATDHSCGGLNCTLREAIEAANNDGLDSTIELLPGQYYAISGVDNTADGPNGLPPITTLITINGHGAHIMRQDYGPYVRLFDVEGGFLTLNEIELGSGKLDPSVSPSAGGAILDKGKLVVKNCYLSNNSAKHGGAIFNPGGAAAWIYNSTFYANSAQDGAIVTFDSLDLYGNTFVDNIGVTQSVLSLAYGPDTKYNFYNNLFVASDSSVPLCNLGGPGTIIAAGGNLATDNSCTGFGITTYSAINAVAPPNYNGGPTATMAIRPVSSAIDVGNVDACQNANIAGRDQRGKPRSVDGNGDGLAQCDVGAFEYAPPSPAPRPFVYDFGGFYPPVEPAPALNKAQAGQAMPVKFSLGGDYGLAVISPGYPFSQEVNCTTLMPFGPPVDPSRSEIQPGQSGLRYDPDSGQYILVWKTDKTWTGTCRALVIRLADSTEHLAYFQFK